MKKTSLVLLPVLGALLLAGCTSTPKRKKKSSSTSGISVTSQTSSPTSGAAPTSKTPSPTSGTSSGGGGGGTSVTPITGDITITADSIRSFVPEGSTYPKAAYSFTQDGVSFNATAKVGLKSANTTGGNYYNDNGAMQLRSWKDGDGGTISVAEACPATKITLQWFATYASEETQYQPVVKVGDSADAINTTVACNEGSPVKGTATGGKEYDSNKKKDFDVYAYVTTYDVSGHSYFSVSAPNGAFYCKAIVVNK